jgi:hypothetical protein
MHGGAYGGEIPLIHGLLNLPVIFRKRFKKHPDVLGHFRLVVTAKLP